MRAAVPGATWVLPARPGVPWFRGRRDRIEVIVLTRLLAVILLALIPVTDVGAADGDSRRLQDYLLYLGEGSSRLWGDGHEGVVPDEGQPRLDGTWWLTPAPIREGRLSMRVEVEPPSWTLPIEAGPAMLVVSLNLGGAFEGDIYRRHLVSVQPTALPPCAFDSCHFAADIEVDLRRLPHIARDLEDFHGSSAEIDLALIRSFGAGTWLQVVEDGDLVECESFVASPEPCTGPAVATGLFPAMTATGRYRGGNDVPFDYAAAMSGTREALGDPSGPVESRDLRFVATVDGCDREQVAPTLGTPDGHRVVFDVTSSGVVDGSVALPVGSTWRLEGDPGATPIVIELDDMAVTARFACVHDTPEVSEVVVGVVSPVGASPVPSMSESSYSSSAFA